MKARARPAKAGAHAGALRFPAASSQLTLRVMKANRGRDTGPEVALRRALWASGVRGYRTNVSGVPGRPDLLFRRSKLAVLVHGCFWHRCPHCKLALPKAHRSFWARKFRRNMERDRRTGAALRQQGYRVLVLWECELERDPGQCVLRVSRLLNGSPSSRRTSPVSRPPRASRGRPGI